MAGVVRVAGWLSAVLVAVLIVAAHLAVAVVALGLNPWPFRWAVTVLRAVVG